MGDLLFYLAAFVFVIALIVLGAWLWRSLLENGVAVPGATLFNGTKQKRIGAIETASIDGKRKLVLIRRDHIEHLIMTGGPVDVVIETEITPPDSASQQPVASHSTASHTISSSGSFIDQRSAFSSTDADRPAPSNVPEEDFASRFGGAMLDKRLFNGKGSSSLTSND